MIARLWEILPEDWRREFAAWRAEVWVERTKLALRRVDFWRARAGE